MKAARGWALALALSIALGIWALFVWQPPLVAGLASALSDRYYSFNTRAPSSEIVFVAVDHAAVKRFGRWPWPRETLADCIARLNQASLIALDMVFSEPTDPPADARLGAVAPQGAALAAHGAGGAPDGTEAWLQAIGAAANVAQADIDAAKNRVLPAIRV